MGTSPTLGAKPSFLQLLTQTVYLDYVLKFGGIVILAVAFFNSWSHVPLIIKIAYVIGPVMWFVGERFNKIYR